MNNRKTQTTAHKETGFSLVEVLIVICVIGILAAMVIIALQNAFDRAKQKATMGDMRTIAQTIQTYYVDYGQYPANGLSMSQLVGLLIPLQTNVLPVEDHWRHPYVYSSDATGYTIESFGKDGVDGLESSYTTRFEFDRDLVLINGMFVASPES